MTTEQALDTAFDNMPEKFTANKFCEEIKKLGLDNDIISSGIANRYYSKRVKKITKRLFIKKPQFVEQTTSVRKEFNVVEAIEGLKKLGYKILKPTYTEI